MAKKPKEKIKGWGIDADPKNDPAYPMKNRTGNEPKGYTWDRPTQQPLNIEALHSIERPNVTAVFGSSAPPSGFSGVLRRFAFKYGEGSFTHWLTLLVADRVDMVEGVFKDVSKGHIPNFWAEKGGRAIWKYDRSRVYMAIINGTLALSSLFTLLMIGRYSEKEREARLNKELEKQKGTGWRHWLKRPR